MDEEKCTQCHHLKSHHIDPVGCVNRHCACKNEEWYAIAETAAASHKRERRAERDRLGLANIAR